MMTCGVERADMRASRVWLGGSFVETQRRLDPGYHEGSSEGEAPNREAWGNEPDLAQESWRGRPLIHSFAPWVDESAEA